MIFDRISEGERVLGAELGFFTQPVYFGDHQVLKTYHGTMTEEEGEALLRAHTRFVERLGSAGVKIPPTSAEIVMDDNGYTFRIVQERFLPSELGGEILRSGSEREVLAVTAGVVQGAVTFLNELGDGSIGFHPTFRNYAFRDNQPYYIDTFPPYGSQNETAALLLRHAPLPPDRLAVLAPLVDRFIAEYYDPSLMVSGIVGTASRMRPEYEKVIKSQVSEFVRGNLKVNVNETLDAIMRNSEQKNHFLLLQALSGVAQTKSSRQPLPQ